MAISRTNFWGNVYQDGAIPVGTRSAEPGRKWSRRKFLSTTIAVSAALWIGIGAAALMIW